MTRDQIRACLETVSRQAAIPEAERRAYVAGAEWVLANLPQDQPEQETTPMNADDDKIVETKVSRLDDCCSAARPCSHQKRDPYSLCDVCEKALAVARQHLTRPTPMRSAEEVRAEIERLGQADSFGAIGYLRSLCWVLNEQDTGR